MVLVSSHTRFVYVLKNADCEPHFYIGVTSDVRARLADHNAGRCPHTARRRPWQVHVVIEFTDEPRALRFERYLKSGSGRAFAKRHFGWVCRAGQPLPRTPTSTTSSKLGGPTQNYPFSATPQFTAFSRSANVCCLGSVVTRSFGSQGAGRYR